MPLFYRQRKLITFTLTSAGALYPIIFNLRIMILIMGKTSAKNLQTEGNVMGDGVVKDPRSEEVGRGHLEGGREAFQGRRRKMGLWVDREREMGLRSGSHAKSKPHFPD